MGQKKANDTSGGSREKRQFMSSGIHAIAISILFIGSAYFLFKFEVFPFAKAVALVLAIWSASAMAWGLLEIYKVIKPK